MTDIDPQLSAGFRHTVAVDILADGGEHFHIHTHKGHIVGNVSAHASQADGDLAGIGVRRNQISKAAATDIHIYAANHHRIGTGAQHIALAGNVALFQQIADVDRHGRPGDIQPLCQLLLGDHGVRRDQLQDLPFPLCHLPLSFFFMYAYFII